MTDSPDPWEDPGWLEYAESAKKELYPMIKGSALGLSFFDGEHIEPRMACELGYLILLDKPIIAVVEPGVKVPDKLVKIADEIVEAAPMEDLDFQKRLKDAIARVQAKLACEVIAGLWGLTTHIILPGLGLFGLSLLYAFARDVIDNRRDQ